MILEMPLTKNNKYDKNAGRYPLVRIVKHLQMALVFLFKKSTRRNINKLRDLPLVAPPPNPALHFKGSLINYIRTHNIKNDISM